MPSNPVSDNLRPRKAWWLLRGGLIALLAVLVGVGYWYFWIAVAVPDVEGKTAAQAEAALDEVGLVMGELIYAPQAEGVRGTVIASQPSAGKHVQPQSTVVFTIAGAEILTVPSLQGLTRDEAASALEAAGFVVGDVTEDFHSTVAAGSVVAQNPEPQARADRDSGVGFVLSKGKDMRTVPDVVGLTKTDAEQALKTAGFTVTVLPVESSQVAAGGVVSQSVAAGESVEVGTVIALEVSQGPARVRVPAVTGLFLTDAQARIRAAGLVPKDVWHYGPPANALGMGYIYDQSPNSGASVPKESVVSIYTWGESQ